MSPEIIAYLQHGATVFFTFIGIVVAVVVVVLMIGVAIGKVRIKPIIEARNFEEDDRNDRRYR